jgi:nitrite reductase (NADH) small subunit
MHVTLGSVQSIPEGEGRCFSVGERKLAVFRARSGRVFAVQAACPHRGGPLADGLVGGHSVICPLHALCFDLETGRAADGSCSLATYPATLGPNGQIVVEVARD